MLELRNCVFVQGSFRLSANWSLEQGERLAVIGPSGAGKSTLLAGLAGFAESSKGALLQEGQSMQADPAARPFAMLFQDHNLFAHLTVAQNVGLGIAPSLKLSGADHENVENALERVGLGGFGTRKPSELSGGQQSRAALARVLVMARPIILLDEPFSALGPAQRVEMLDLVKDVSEHLSASLIMVTHDPGEALRLGGSVSFVQSGVAHAPVGAQAFFEAPPDGLRDYIGNWRP